MKCYLIKKWSRANITGVWKMLSVDTLDSYLFATFCSDPIAQDKYFKKHIHLVE